MSERGRERERESKREREGARTAHITRGHGPVPQHNVPRVPAVKAIRVDGRPLRAGLRGHVEVRHGHVLAVRDKGVPELGLAPVDAVDEHVGAAPDGQRDGPALHVAAVPVLVDPHLAVAVKHRLAVAPHGDVGAAEQPGGDEAGVGDGHGVRGPVGDVVGAPQEGAVDGDVAVLEGRCVHDLPDVVGPLGEHDGAVLAALREGAQDLRRVVA